MTPIADAHRGVARGKSGSWMRPTTMRAAQRPEEEPGS